jgi:hypothetical protein
VIQKNAVYRKSALGAEAIANRSHGLLPKQRSVLIMVDGKRTFDDLIKVAAALGDPEQLLGDLESGGFIEPSGATVAVRPGASPLPGPVAATASTAFAGGFAEAPAPAALPQGPSLTDAKRLAIRLITQILGPVGEDLCIRVEAARDLEAYVAAVRKAHGVIREVRGGTEAGRFGQEIEAHLPQA